LSFRLVFESLLSAPEGEVWAEVSTLEGVNRELSPWIRMTAPAEARGRSLEEAPIGEPLFASFLLAFRVVPFDRHELRLVAASRGHFLERSHSSLQRVWEHERWVEGVAGGTRVRDRLFVEPRLPSDALVRSVVSALFRWRHRRLRARFGEGPKRAPS
jgi:ligand-binding SRPBCC domain-containing protein